MNIKCIICNHNPLPYLEGIFDDRYGSKGKYNIYKCPACGFGRVDKIIPAGKLGKFYEKHYRLSLKKIKQIKKEAKIPNKIVSFMTGTDNVAHHYISKGAKVLDIGSASSVSLLEIKMLGGQAYGVEPDPSAQRIAKLLDLKVHQGFIQDQPFPNIKFDYITASQVIEHEPNPKAYMNAVYKKLKKNGQLILSFPNFDSLGRKIFGRRWLHWHVPYHVNFFTRKSFQKLAENTGFKIVKVRTITPNLWIILQIRMLFSKTEEGKANTFWTNSDRVNKEKWLKIIGNYLYYSIYILIYIIIIPINRTLDFLGLGESFLFILRKK